MSVWAALGWGAFSSASLYIGQALAGPMRHSYRATGEVMGFGAGTMISAVAYELIPESTLKHGLGIGVGFALGALTYFIADRLVDTNGGADRQSVDPASPSSSGAAMFLGALLDGIPEAFVLGITLELGGGISVAFVAAVFVSNIPQGIAGTTSLKDTGYTDRRITWMWTALTAACALIAASGYLLAHSAHVQGLYSQAFAAGAVLTMLANSMMPEAFEHGGKRVGLYTVFGYLVAAALSIVS
ncbi:ZIP family metal transporter [Jatrophihabitans sp. DSM 45814]